MEKISLPDAALIRSVLAGNKEDFKILVERYQQKIFSYLYHFLYQDRDTAEDITQSVFLKAYQNLNKVDTNRPFQPWLYRIAHNEAANYIRFRSRKKEVGLYGDQWDQIAGVEEKKNQERMENRDLVHFALGKIKTEYREILLLYFYEEKSYEEISMILEININTVGTMLKRAKEQVEKRLRQMER